jgi:transcriptional regulator with XRE-family HTH domain
MHTFGENLRRLFGLHDLRASEGARLIGVSPQSVSEWMRGRRRPSLRTLFDLASFLEVPAERLLRAPFGELLEQELSDQARFARVEKKIGELQREDALTKPRTRRSRA